MSPLHLFFHWPDGGVYSNIVASVIWTTPSFFLGMYVSHRKLKKHINAKHEDLKAHITSEHAASREHLENTLGKRKRK